MFFTDTTASLSPNNFCLTSVSTRPIFVWPNSPSVWSLLSVLTFWPNSALPNPDLILCLTCLTQVSLSDLSCLSKFCLTKPQLLSVWPNSLSDWTLLLTCLTQFSFCLHYHSVWHNILSELTDLAVWPNFFWLNSLGDYSWPNKTPAVSVSPHPMSACSQ